MNLRVVLLRPRNPLNIGACARAMANFGLSDLVVIDPFEPVWRETRSAPGAEAVVKGARLAASWEKAVKDCAWVIGTSSFHQRSSEQAVIELPGLKDYLSPVSRAERVALVFGPERGGLSNGELARCRAVARIPTQPEAPSMNLAQAVAVTLYELHREGKAQAPAPAPAQELEPLIESLAGLGRKIDYPAGYKEAARLGRIRQALQPAALPPATARFLLSFCRKMARKIPR